MKKLTFLTLFSLLTTTVFAADRPEKLPPLGASRPEKDKVLPNDCGTYRGIEQDILARHQFMSAVAKAKLPTSQTRDVGNIAIIEDDGFLIYEDSDGLHINDGAVSNRFYQTHPDNFDFITMFRNFDADMHGFAYHFNVRNNIYGIGLPIFNYTGYMGSAGRLKGFSNQNDINYQVDDPHFHMYRIHSTMTGMLHETMHQWAAFLDNPNQVVNSSHWYSFCHTKSSWGDSTTSAMEGYNWTDNGGGDYQGYAYGNGLFPLDLYVMGLYDPVQVPDIWYLQNPTVTSPTNIFVPPYYALPIELHATGTPDSLSIWDIVSANGFREPDTSDSQKAFNMAFILVVKNGEIPKGEELARIERIRQEFEEYFYASTESLATMNTSLFGSNPLEIVTLELRGAALGYPYAESVYAVGGTKPYSWSQIGSLPSGVSFADGFISGTPTATGSYPVTFIAQDAASQADTVNLVLTVSDTGQSEIVINELELWERYNVGAGIELYNKGTQAMDLIGWTVEVNGIDGLISYTLPSAVLAPDNYLVLLESAGINTSSRLFIGEDIGWITGGSGFCALKDDLGNGIDFVRFGTSTQVPPSGTFWTGPNPVVTGEFHNLVRDSLSSDTDNSNDFVECNGNLGRKNLCGPALCVAKPGDANASNTITLADAIAIVNYIFTKPGCNPAPSCWLSGLVCRGDANGSMTVTLGDAIYLVNYIFNKPGGPWTPLPSGTCCQPVP